MAAWASPLHFRVRTAHRTGTTLRIEPQREDEQKWEWVILKEEGGVQHISSVGRLRRQTPRQSKIGPGQAKERDCE